MFAMGQHDDPNATPISTRTLIGWAIISLSRILLVPVAILGGILFLKGRRIGSYLLLAGLSWDFAIGVFWLYGSSFAGTSTIVIQYATLSLLGLFLAIFAADIYHRKRTIGVV